MFNKALEVIETREFFGVAPDQIEVIIHPEIHRSIRWSAFATAAIMAHLGAPDMRHAIGYALNWPDARRMCRWRGWIWRSSATLTFRAPDMARYPGAAPGARGDGDGAGWRGRPSTRPRRWRWTISSPAASASCDMAGVVEDDA